MASTVTTKVKLNVKATLAHSVGTASNINNIHQFLQQTASLTAGTGDRACDLVYTLSKTMTATTDTIDIDGATLENVVGETVTMVTVNLIAISNTGSTNNIEVVADVNSTDTVTAILHPGADLVWTSPSNSDTSLGNITVEGTSGDTYTILVLGQSA
ncbi:MAG: hypothetical protein GY841_08710 [FCB group bacterium]|nr:hypothetical protein [FCB group bacterium]